MIDALDDPFGFTLQCSAYPNPTIDFLTLKVENYNNENISFQLYDLSGILIQNKKLEGNETHISMNHLVPATYFLKVVENKKEIKTFKIIKH